MTALFKNRWLWVCVGIALVGAGAWAWLERPRLTAWYHVRRLAAADPDSRGSHVAALASLRTAAIPPLVRGLGEGGEVSRAVYAAALADLVQAWQAEPALLDALLRTLADAVAGLDGPGRRHALAVAATVVAAEGREGLSAAGTQAATRLINWAGHPCEVEARTEAVRLAERVLALQPAPAAETLQQCRTLAEAGLKDERADCRAAAVRLASRPGVQGLDLLVPLIGSPAADSSPEVRRLALLALGGREDLLATDDLLPFLHDADSEVRAVCEQALRSRGVSGGHLKLARLITDPDPAMRARVPAQIGLFPDLDTRMWLDRLSRDPSPAVRAAALRAAAETPDGTFADRVREVGQKDPSPTVRQLANYYLQLQCGRRGR